MVGTQSSGAFWEYDMSMHCYQGQHLDMAIALGVVGFSLFALGE